MIYKIFLLSVISLMGIHKLDALTPAEQAGMEALMARQAANIEQFTSAGTHYYQSKGFSLDQAKAMASKLANEPSGYKYLHRLQKQGGNFHILFNHFQDFLVRNVPLTSNHFDDFWNDIDANESY